MTAVQLPLTHMKVHAHVGRLACPHGLPLSTAFQTQMQSALHVVSMLTSSASPSAAELVLVPSPEEACMEVTAAAVAPLLLLAWLIPGANSGLGKPFESSVVHTL